MISDLRGGGGGGKAVMRIVKRRLCWPIAYCDHNISDLFTFRQIGREKLERESERERENFVPKLSPLASEESYPI